MTTINITQPLVSVSWLKENLNHPNLIILDATIPKVVGGNKPKDFNKIGIKNARFFDIKGNFSDKETIIPNMLPNPKDFENACSDLGIGNQHTIVVYDQLGIYSSARVWWMFTSMGFDSVAILDGGLPAWLDHGFPVEPFPLITKYPKGNFKAHFRPELVINAKQVLAQIDNIDTSVFDARSEGRFNATAPEPRADLKSGHIPNSKSLPYTDLLSEGKMLPVDLIKETFSNFNIGNKKLIFTCGSGITACILLLAADLAGYKNAAVYDGSWSEWGQLDDVPIES